MHFSKTDERPRERCLRAGAGALNLKECLALLLGSGPVGKGALGVASALITHDLSGLSTKDEAHLLFSKLEDPEFPNREIIGIGDAQRAKLMATFEICRRYAAFRESKARRPQKQMLHSKSSDWIYSEALSLIPQAERMNAKEWLAFVPVYPLNELGGFCLFERGVRTHVNTDPLELFARLLPLKPQAFFLFHNHPSGDLKPSPEDVQLTRDARNLALRFGIVLLGHGIVSSRGESWIMV